MATEKTPLHQHEHPVYPWIALFVSLFIVLGLAGWYYLSFTDSLNSDAVSAVTGAYSGTVTKVKTVSTGTAVTTTTPTNTSQADVDSTVSAIDKTMNGTSSNDFADTTLNNASVGVSN